MRNRLLLRIHQALVRQSNITSLSTNASAFGVGVSGEVANVELKTSYRSLLNLYTTAMIESSSRVQRPMESSPSDVLVSMNIAMCLSIAKTIGHDCK